MEHFGSIRAVFDATQTEQCVFEGGATRYFELQASLELARRYTVGRLRRGQAFCNPKDTRDYLLLELQGRPQEVFACLFLDSQHRLIRFEDMFRGAIDSGAVHVREIASRALTLNAAAIIAAHDHPSGGQRTQRRGPGTDTRAGGRIVVVRRPIAGSLHCPRW